MIREQALQYLGGQVDSIWRRLDEVLRLPRSPISVRLVRAITPIVKPPNLCHLDRELLIYNPVSGIPT